MKQIELLAPAKDKETAIIAIESGCDAVYIGSPKFGARQAVGNSLEDIKEVVDYAHKFYVKVHVTINTILTDNELKEAQKLIFKLYEIGVDAIIVQDMGILKLAVDGKLPPIPIHASTQCDNRTLEKAKFFADMGVSRVILARELSIEQIKKICNAVSPLTSSHSLPSSPSRGEEEYLIPQIEVETFIHGALCVSYSGQCYLSHYIGGRSANRGECAQACRKKYTLVDENGKIIAKDKYLLSLKDFNASKHIKKLIDAGVKSFKIEGRLKDKNYVKNVVAFYRQEIDKFAPKISSGKVFLDFEPDVNKSFNRGFTDYFLTLKSSPELLSSHNSQSNSTLSAFRWHFPERGEPYNFETPKAVGEYLGKIKKVGKDWFEIGSSDSKKTGGQASFIINAQDGLYFNGQGCLVNKIEYPSPQPSPARGEGKSNLSLLACKPVLPAARGEGVSVRIYPNRMDGIAVGVDVYRNFDAKFEKQLENSKTKRRIGVEFIYKAGVLSVKDEDGNSVQIPLSANEAPKNPEKMRETFIKQLQKTGDSDFYVIDVNVDDLPFMPVSEINELRRTILAQLMKERLKNYIREIQKPLKYTKFPKQKLDYRANIHNQTAKSFYEACGCEVCEMSAESGSKPTELMRTKHCLKYAFNMCKSPKKLFLIDEKGKRYPLKFDCKNCEMCVMAGQTSKN